MSRRAVCGAVQIWPEIKPHGIRLVCSLPEGHNGDHAASDIEYIVEGSAGTSWTR